MKYTENAINVLAARIYKGIGRAWIVKNLKSNMDKEKIIALLNNGAKVDYCITLEDFEKKRSTVKTLIKNLEGFMDGVVAIGDNEFPTHRGNVKNSEKPIFLFYRGNIQLLNTSNKNVAVIGLLNPDDNIEKAEKEVVNKLVNNGATIVSGLALGCDSIAHRQALHLKGKTIAILPSPLNNILPATNKELAFEIVKNDGLLITEYLTDAKSKMELAGRYQERDRLQALFSDCIVLSASYAKNDLGNDSGSRLAMGYAIDYTIPRAVIYNSNTDANNHKYDLNRQCIMEQKEITIINRENLNEATKKILFNKTTIENKPSQSSFLDAM